MIPSSKNGNDTSSRIIKLLRYGLFLSFYILAVRFLLVAIDSAPIQNPLKLVMILVGIGALSFWKTQWSLYGLAAIVPLASGLQMLGLTRSIPFLSLIFACIYLVWLPRRLFFVKGSLSPKTRIGNLVDIFSGVVLLSLINTFWSYPVDLVLYHFEHTLSSGSQNEPFYSLEAAWVLLEGLFFYRVIESEIEEQLSWRSLVLIFKVQTFIIIIFSFYQLFYKIPQPLFGFAIYAPFDDIHSYGSYLTILFFISFGLVYGSSLKVKIVNGIFAGFLLFFSVLSFSRITWLAIIVGLIFFLLNNVSLKKRLLVICSLSVILLYVNLFPGFLTKLEGTYVKRFVQLVVPKENPDISRLFIWQRALSIISVFPLTGSGIGTFYRVSPFYQKAGIQEFRDLHENAHNYFLQIASDLGIPGLLVLLSILFYAYKAGYRILSQNKETRPLMTGLLVGLSAYLITCLTGHPLLLLNQQFLFWLVISSIVIPSRFIPQERWKTPFPSKLTLLILGFIGVLAAGYSYKFWKMPPAPQTYEYGFYPYELRDGKKVRWTARETYTRTQVGGHWMGLELYATPYNIDSSRLNFKIFINGKLLDEINFSKPEEKSLKYYLPYKKNETLEIKTIVNKTFKPVRLGINRDSRSLGVMVSEIKFYDAGPRELP